MSFKKIHEERTAAIEILVMITVLKNGMFDNFYIMLDSITITDSISSKETNKGYKMKVNYEHTDTFGGEANYSWVKRGVIELPDNSSDLTIVKKVKEALEMTGVKCDKENYMDMIKLKPRKICQVIFITFES